MLGLSILRHESCAGTAGCLDFARPRRLAWKDGAGDGDIEAGLLRIVQSLITQNGDIVISQPPVPALILTSPENTGHGIVARLGTRGSLQAERDCWRARVPIVLGWNPSRLHRW